MRRSKGFTLIELLVVVSIISLLVTIVLPSLGKAREMARQSACATHLGGIGKALSMYFTKERNRYPSFKAEDITSFLTGPDKVDLDDESAFNAMNGDADARNSTPQAWFLLVADDMCQPEIFLCPSDGVSEPYEAETTNTGFDSWYNISYALQPTARISDNAAALGKSGQKGGVCWAGDKPKTDKSPPASDQELQTATYTDDEGNDVTGYAGYTANHGEDGGNFLTAGGSVTFERQRDMMVGALQDFVYSSDVNSSGTVANDDTSIDGETKYINDTYLIWGTDDS